ncbi:hypothetical protein B0T21DRAFT_376881 [Apiosordaria backusii]|uniref:Uncharacterized protein n=1 Tax=Apiosordaria backusii TaxID=314023 RepID=A0AA40A3S8_9PEZI|nr:hypothetical protein B0T21DRAFT_376881 [Apiosordaria backusii]
MPVIRAEILKLHIGPHCCQDEHLYQLSESNILPNVTKSTSTTNPETPVILIFLSTPIAITITLQIRHGAAHPHLTDMAVPAAGHKRRSASMVHLDARTFLIQSPVNRSTALGRKITLNTLASVLVSAINLVDDPPDKARNSKGGGGADQAQG